MTDSQRIAELERAVLLLATELAAMQRTLAEPIAITINYDDVVLAVEKSQRNTFNRAKGQ